MADINVSELVKKMLGAAESTLAKKWPDARDYAAVEFQKIGDTIAFVQREVAAGRMAEDRARLHLEMQRNATRMVLLCVEGLEIPAVEAALNAALAAVKETVNSALDFALLQGRIPTTPHLFRR